jgi:hypothetical protein|tara:strand:- start:14646 stop:15113 length:468 start_codon:yes stop_codon:yes gene_type:complete
MDNQSKPLDLRSIILRLDGIATSRDSGVPGTGFTIDEIGWWRPLTGDSLYAVEEQCVRLHDELAARIFGGLHHYHAHLPTAPSFLAEAGLNSESLVERDMFGKLLQKFSDFPELNRFLYLYDCRMLVSAIQECTTEICQLMGEFYRILNLDPFYS